MNDKWIRGKIKLIHDFCKARNAADASKVDANANVTVKDIAVVEAELYKRETIELNRTMVCAKLSEMFGSEHKSV